MAYPYHEGYGSDAGDHGRRLTRAYSYSTHSPVSRPSSTHPQAHPQWKSWNSHRPRPSTAGQPFTINLTFGGGADGPYGGAPHNLSISSDGQDHRRQASSPWVDELEQAKIISQLPPWRRNNDMQVNLFQQPDLPQFPYDRLGDHLDEKAFPFPGFTGYPAEKHQFPIPPPTPSKPPTQQEEPDPEEQVQWIYEPVESGFWRVIQNFDFKWYGATMGTGIVSILLFTFSTIYTSSSSLLHLLTVVFFLANAALFALVTLATLLRYARWPRLLGMLLRDPGQAMYVGALPMGLATLVTMTANVAVPRLGPAWATVAWAFWWLDLVLSVATAIGIPWLLQVAHPGIVDLDKMTAGWLLPIVAPIVCAATGAVVASALVDVDDDPGSRALATVLASYALLGLGLPAALCVLAIYLLRLATRKLPPAEHMVSTFLPLGPLGQGGFAAQKLGEQALRVFPLTGALPAIGGGGRLVGEIFYAVGFLVALLLWGFGLMWLCFAALSVTRRQRVPFGLGWWAFTFPLGVFALSALEMGANLPSAAFRALGTVLGVAVMMLWVMVAGTLVARLVGGRNGWGAVVAANSASAATTEVAKTSNGVKGL
ncbi:voltage-dependent anion channel-domain-containing protein [Xylariaceae sp. FL0804]|nr:voltage-dependent anion channel-domain-containing protein [Xylariaceae sp. FL0804]